MRYFLFLALLFQFCSQRKHQVENIDVADTQLAEVEDRLPVIKREDSLEIMNAFAQVRYALNNEDGLILSKLNCEKSYWPTFLKKMLNAEKTTCFTPVCRPIKSLYEIDLANALRDSLAFIRQPFRNFDNLIKDSVLYPVFFKTKHHYKNLNIGSEHVFDFAKHDSSFCLVNYHKEEVWRQIVYPSIDSIDNYFPKPGLIELDEQPNNSLNKYEIVWFSETLSSCAEPKIFNYKGSDEIYRFLWLRSFHLPVVIRIQKRRMDFQLTWKMVIPEYLDRPAEIVKANSIYISFFKWNEFKSLLDKSLFWQQPEGEDMSDRGTDGAVWVMEGYKEGQYHVINRWSPQRSDFRKACLYLLKISNLSIKDEDIY